MARLTLVVGVALAALSSPAVVPPCFAQPTQAPRDLTAPARQAVSQVVYASTATSAATERAFDTRINEQRSAIEALHALLTQAGGRSDALAAELAAAQEQYCAALAERDRAYAQEISILRGAAEDIAASPEGLAALERFNAGDELGALLVLDRLRDARVRARQVLNDIESAAEARDIATLALETHYRGRLDTAAVIARYLQIVALDPREFWDWSALTSLHREAGDLSAAAVAAEHATRLAEDDNQRAAAASISGDVQQDRGNLTDAATFFERSLALTRNLALTTPNNYTRHNLSLSLNKLADIRAFLGSTDEALTLLGESETIMRALLRVNPNSATLQRGLYATLDHMARAYLEQNNLSEAAQRRDETIVIARTLASHESEQGQAQRDLAIAITGAGEIADRRGDGAAALERYQESVAIVRRLAVADDSALNLYTLANILDRLGQEYWFQNSVSDAAQSYQEAFEVEQRLVVINPNSSDARHGLAFAHRRLADVAVARRDFGAAETHYAASLQISRAVVADAPEMFRYRDTLAGILERFGDVRVAQQRYTDALPMLEEAQLIRERLIASNPTAEQNQALRSTRDRVSWVRGVLSSIDARKNRKDALASDARRETAPNQRAIILVQLGNMYYDDRDYDRALMNFEEAIQLNPHNADAAYGRGNVRMRQGQSAAAISDYDVALQLNPDFADALGNRGLAHHLLGDFASALTDFNQALAVRPSAIDFSNRGLTYYAQRDYMRAIADTDEAARLDPSNLRYQTNRCVIRAVSNRELDIARAACDAGLAQTPGDANLLDTRGLIGLRERQWQAAWRDYDAAVRSDAQSASAVYGRGIAALRLGRVAEGRADLAHATALDANIAGNYEDYGISP